WGTPRPPPSGTRPRGPRAGDTSPASRSSSRTPPTRALEVDAVALGALRAQPGLEIHVGLARADVSAVRGDVLLHGGHHCGRHRRQLEPGHRYTPTPASVSGVSSTTRDMDVNSGQPPTTRPISSPVSRYTPPPDMP